jgi:hypothetical protein
LAGCRNASCFHGIRVCGAACGPRNRCDFGTSCYGRSWLNRSAPLGASPAQVRHSFPSCKAIVLIKCLIDLLVCFEQANWKSHLQPMSSFATANTRGADYVRPAFIGALSAIQICILLWAYSFSPHCTDIASYSVCLIPSQIGLRALAFLFVFGLIVLARPNIRNLLCCDDRTEDVTFRLVGVQVVGFCLIMLPWAVGFRSSDPITFALGSLDARRLSGRIWCSTGARQSQAVASGPG